LAAKRHTKDAGGVLIHEKCCFSYFCGTGTARRWFCTARR